jgi:hypothetical protein
MKVITNRPIDESIPEIQEWMAEGQALAHAASGHQWRIADWMLWGEDNIGNIRQAYDLAEQATGYKRKTLQEWAYVARNSSMRMEDLTFNHHQVVVALLPEAQKRCLERASAEEMSVGDLREMARWEPHRLEIDPAEAKQEASLLLKFAHRCELDKLEILARQVGFISDEYNSAIGRLIYRLLGDHLKTHHPELMKASAAEYEKAGRA